MNTTDTNRWGFVRISGSRRGGVGLSVLGVAVLLALGLGAFLWWTSRSADAGSGATAADIFEVERGSFDVAIPASGELAALKQIEIRNPIEGRAVITYIVDEGVRVQKGDVLVRFAPEELEEEIKDAELDVLSAKNAVTAAENQLAIQESQNESRLQQAELDVKLAELALNQWREEHQSRLLELQLNLETAKKNYERLAEKYEESVKLAEQGFISADEKKRDEIAKIEAEVSVRLAESALDVYKNFQSERDREQAESDLAQAKAELLRVRKQNEAEYVQKLDDLKTKQGQLEIREGRLAEDREQLEACVVRAPSPGLVVYGTSLESDGWRDDEQPPQIGSEIRRNDLIMVLPDVSQMVAAVKVHESVSGRIEPGQRATIVSDALPNKTLHGSVLNVGVLAQGGGWRDPNRRDYTVKILLEDAEGLGLKPSMRCKAEIFLDRVEDSMYVPIQAIYRDAGRPFVYVPTDDGYEQRAVKLGPSSELNVAIRDGLTPGERVLLREPDQAEVIATLPPAPDRPAAADADAGDGERVARANGENSPAGDGPRARGRNGAAQADGQGGEQNAGSMLARFDANGDGALQKDELPEPMQDLFDRIDANGDGQVDAEEVETMRTRLRSAQ